MRATELLHNLGQSLWLDNITRDLLDGGTLQHYIDELSVTGLTSNPTIFDHAIKNSTAYDAAIREKLAQGKSGEALFFELALPGAHADPFSHFRAPSLRRTPLRHEDWMRTTALIRPDREVRRWTW